MEAQQELDWVAVHVTQQPSSFSSIGSRTLSQNPRPSENHSRTGHPAS